jgi:hypothetical protein
LRNAAPKHGGGGAMTSMTIRVETKGDTVLHVTVVTKPTKTSTAIERGALNMMKTLSKVLIEKLYLTENKDAKWLSTLDPIHEQLLSEQGIEVTIDHEKFNRFLEQEDE